MHYRMFVTTTLSDDATSEDARREVINYLASDDSFCGEGGRFGSPLCDFFEIGGRWSGYLAKTVIGESLRKAIIGRFPQEGDEWCPHSLGMTGFEPATSTSRTCKTRVPSGNLSEVAATADSRCTNGCTSKPPKRRKREADAAAVGAVETLADVKPEPGETDFAAALKMLALLPLSDEERAEAVRRLLKGGDAAR